MHAASKVLEKDIAQNQEMPGTFLDDALQLLHKRFGYVLTDTDL